MEMYGLKLIENHIKYRTEFYYFKGKEGEPHFKMLTLFFIGKYMKILCFKLDQNRIIDEKYGGTEAGPYFTHVP